MYISLHEKYLLFLSDFNENLIFSTGFPGGGEIELRCAMKIRPVAAELFQADGQTDRHTWRRQQSLFDIFRTHLKTGRYRATE
jgi:hypothetical protein